jgi:hypothetical protein
MEERRKRDDGYDVDKINKLNLLYQQSQNDSDFFGVSNLKEMMRKSNSTVVNLDSCVPIHV